MLPIVSRQNDTLRFHAYGTGTYSIGNIMFGFKVKEIKKISLMVKIGKSISTVIRSKVQVGPCRLLMAQIP